VKNVWNDTSTSKKKKIFSYGAYFSAKKQINMDHAKQDLFFKASATYSRHVANDTLTKESNFNLLPFATKA